MNGRQEMKSIVIDKSVMESGDAEMLQDLVITAVNEAVRIGRANLEREMANLSGGIRIPGMFYYSGEGGAPSSGPSSVLSGAPPFTGWRSCI